MAEIERYATSWLDALHCGSDVSRSWRPSISSGRVGQFSDTLKLAELLLNDDEDQGHKAVGWVLREVGKRDKVKEVAFLKQAL